MPEPEANGSQLKHGEEVGGVLFITRGDTAAMFDGEVLSLLDIGVGCTVA
jgi:hypothetical protein